MLLDEEGNRVGSGEKRCCQIKSDWSDNNGGG